MSFGRGGARNVPTNDFGDSSRSGSGLPSRSSDSVGFPSRKNEGSSFGRNTDGFVRKNEVSFGQNTGGFGRKADGIFGRKADNDSERKDENGSLGQNTDSGFGHKAEGSFGQNIGGGAFGRKTEGSFGQNAGGGGFGHKAEGSFGQNTGSFGRKAEGSFGQNTDGGSFGRKAEGSFGQNTDGGSFGRKAEGSFGQNTGSFGRKAEGTFEHRDDNDFERKNESGSFGRKTEGSFGQSTGGGGFGRKAEGTFERKDNDGFERNTGGAFNGGFSRNNAQDPFKQNNDMNNGFESSTGPSHVPKMRAIDEIFQEDADAAENYLQIRAEDDNVVVTGPKVDTVAVVEKWEEADLEPSLMANIVRAKYSVPRKIQSYAIPMIMDGFDVKGHAETGSGKTAAFLIPIINTIIKKKAANEFKSRRSYPYALIIEPTRELAIQLYDQARKLTDGTDVSVAVAYGKYRVHDNLREISNGCDILVGTPGRLRDFISRGYVLMAELKVLVLDEADRLLEDEFMVEVRKICSAPNFPTKENRQTLLFSATFSPEVQQWADELLREQNVMISNQKFASANNKVVQNFILVSLVDKKDQLIKLLKDELEEKKKELPDGQEPRLRRTLVFVQKKRDADVLSAYLCQENIKSTTINGDRPQQLREESLEQFRTNKVDLVVSTDVCARGIDIKDLDHVINFDLPLDSYVTYVHRIGRTGRLKEGMATSFYDPASDFNLAKELVNGVRESGQLPPDFLVEAAENRLVMPSKDEDDAWGVNTRSMAGLMGGGTSNKPPMSNNNTDDW